MCSYNNRLFCAMHVLHIVGRHCRAKMHDTAMHKVVYVGSIILTIFLVICITII